MHRPGIARVQGDRIVLNGTTMEEVKMCHRNTLILCVKEVNRLVEEHGKRERIAELELQRRREEHEANVCNVTNRINFDGEEAT
ncbi:MAG: hypothetical protein HYX66_04145 [Ignavibacteria bacterium]|nr:hypothetical protein [Ignavibacteria bacterium]